MLEQILNYHPLMPDLATSGQPDADELAAIATAGYRLVINLALHDAEYALPDEAASVRALGMDYVHIAVAFGVPRQDDLRAFFAVMDANAGRNLGALRGQQARIGVHRTVAAPALRRTDRYGFRAAAEPLATRCSVGALYRRCTRPQPD